MVFVSSNPDLRYVLFYGSMLVIFIQVLKICHKDKEEVRQKMLTGVQEQGDVAASSGVP